MLAERMRKNDRFTPPLPSFKLTQFRMWKSLGINKVSGSYESLRPRSSKTQEMSFSDQLHLYWQKGCEKTTDSRLFYPHSYSLNFECERLRACINSQDHMNHFDLAVPKRRKCHFLIRCTYIVTKDAKKRPIPLSPTLIHTHSISNVRGFAPV